MISLRYKNINITFEEQIELMNVWSPGRSAGRAITVLLNYKDKKILQVSRLAECKGIGER